MCGPSSGPRLLISSRPASPAGVVEVGTLMPDGDLLDVNGKPTTLAVTRAGRPAVVVFYRGEWCPYCNLALRAYQAKLVPELDRRGAVLIAISPQRPDGALALKEKDELTFAVLSDPGNQIGGRLGILMTQTDEVRAAQATLGADVCRKQRGRHRHPSYAHRRYCRRRRGDSLGRCACRFHHPHRTRADPRGVQR